MSRPMPPLSRRWRQGGGDDDLLATTRGALNGQEDPSKGPRVDERLDEPVDRVAAVILGDGELEAGLVSGPHQPQALLHGEGDGLLDHDVGAGREGLHTDLLVGVGGGGGVERVEVRMGGVQAGGGGVGLGSAAEQLPAPCRPGPRAAPPPGRRRRQGRTRDAPDP